MRIKAVLLVALFLLVQVAAIGASEIVVKDADSIWEVTSEHSADLISVASSVLPRVSVEYSNSIYACGLYVIPTSLDELTEELSPTKRLIVDHAGSIYASNLHEVPANLAELTGRLTSTRRLIVNQAESTYRLALTVPHELLDVEVGLNTLGSTEVELLPERIALYQNIPNPFNAFTAIRVQFPEASEVRLSVYNLLGQEVRRLVDGKVEAGWYSVLWDGRDSSGRNAASGIYLCRLHAGDFVQTRRIVLLR